MKFERGIPLNKTILYGIFYAVTTIALIIYFIKEKKIEKNRKEKSIKRIDKTLTRWSFFMGNERNFVVKFIDGTFSLALVILLVLFIQKFYIGNFTVPTASMEPTVMIGERFFGNMVTPKFIHPKRGSIVIFREPIEDKVRYTKRLVGLPGETVTIGDNGHLIINGVSDDNGRIYSYGERSLMGQNTWTIPQKGDKIKLIDGVFQAVNKKLTFTQLISYLKENGGKSAPDENISWSNMTFKVNGKTYTDGLFSNITDTEEQLALLQGNRIVKDGNTFEITNGDFYIFKDNLNSKTVKAELEKNSDAIIRITSGTYILNGNTPTGPIMDKEILKELMSGNEVTLKNDFFFTLGDNTNNSADSRYWGFVKDERILGTLLVRYWPLNKMKIMVNE